MLFTELKKEAAVLTEQATAMSVTELLRVILMYLRLYELQSEKIEEGKDSGGQWGQIQIITGLVICWPCLINSKWTPPHQTHQNSAVSPRCTSLRCRRAHIGKSLVPAAIAEELCLLFMLSCCVHECYGAPHVSLFVISRWGALELVSVILVYHYITMLLACTVDVQ